MRTLGKRSRPRLTIAGVERAVELTAYKIFNDSGTSTIMSAFENDDGRDWWLSGSALQSLETGSLWRLALEHSGEQVPFTVAPDGADVPSPDHPWATGTVVIGPPPDLGGTATDERFLFDFTWRIIDAPAFLTEVPDAIE